MFPHTHATERDRRYGRPHGPSLIPVVMTTGMSIIVTLAGNTELPKAADSPPVLHPLQQEDGRCFSDECSSKRVGRTKADQERQLNRNHGGKINIHLSLVWGKPEALWWLSLDKGERWKHLGSCRCSHQEHDPERSALPEPQSQQWQGKAGQRQEGGTWREGLHPRPCSHGTVRADVSGRTYLLTLWGTVGWEVQHYSCSSDCPRVGFEPWKSDCCTVTFNLPTES